MSAETDRSAQLWSSRSHPVPEDMGFQRITWRIERIGWVLLAALIVASLLGVFSSGPLSSGIARDPAGRIEVAYERFARNGASARMQLRVRAEAAEQVVVRFNASFMDAFMIEAMHPRPAEERGGPDGTEMVFRATGNAPLRVYLDLRPEKIGPVKGEIAVAGEPAARVTQFIFP